MGAPIGGIDWEENSRPPESVEAIYQRMVAHAEELNRAYNEILQEFKSLNNYKIGDLKIIFADDTLKLIENEDLGFC